MARLRHAPSFALLFGLGLLAGACSSDDERSLVLIDIELGTNVTAPQNVVLTASQAGADVKSATVPWGTAGAGPLKVGFFIPAGVSGSVTIAAKAFTDNVPVAEGKLANEVLLKIGGTVGPLTLVLDIPAVPGSDGGVDTGTTDTAPIGGEVGDSAPDSGPSNAPLDGGFEVGASDGPRDTTVIDGGQPDVPAAGDDARDAAPAPADTADTALAPIDTLGPVDTTLAPLDTTPPVEVGHTPTWEPAQNIETDPLNASYAPVVAVDPVNEHVYVAWRENTAVKVRRWNRVSAAWENTITVDDRGEPNGLAIGVDTKGAVMLAWGQNSNGSTPTLDGVWMSRTVDGVSFSPAVRITPDPAFDVQLAVARNGTAHAAYGKQGSSGWPLFTAYYDGSGWTENPTTLDANTSYTDSSPLLALNAAGDGLLVFRKDWGIAGTVLSGQTFTTPIMLDPNHATASAYDSAVAMNRKGEGIVIWSEASGSNSVLLARTYNPTVGWSSVSPPIVTSSTVASLAVAMDEQGAVTILFQRDLAVGGVNMMGIHGSTSGSWSDVAVLETDNKATYLVDHYGFPKLAIDGSGNVLGVWRKDLSTAGTTTYGAYGTRFAGGSWLPPVQLGLKSGLNVLDVKVAVADSGFGAATFTYISDTDPESYNVHVAFFR